MERAEVSKQGKQRFLSAAWIAEFNTCLAKTAKPNVDLTDWPEEPILTIELIDGPDIQLTFKDGRVQAQRRLDRVRRTHAVQPGREDAIIRTSTRYIRTTLIEGRFGDVPHDALKGDQVQFVEGGRETALLFAYHLVPGGRQGASVLAADIRELTE